MVMSGRAFICRECVELAAEAVFLPDQPPLEPGTIRRLIEAGLMAEEKQEKEPE